LVDALIVPAAQADPEMIKAAATKQLTLEYVCQSGQLVHMSVVENDMLFVGSKLACSSVFGACIRQRSQGGKRNGLHRDDGKYHQPASVDVRGTTVCNV